MFLQKCLEEELSIPLLLEHFGMPVEEFQAAPQDDAETCEADEDVDSDCNVFMFYKQNFGSLSQKLNGRIEDLSEECILQSLQIAHKNNKPMLAYVKGILRDGHGGYT
jgi:DnaD/phage-associated family protein